MVKTWSDGDILGQVDLNRYELALDDLNNKLVEKDNQIEDMYNAIVDLMDTVEDIPQSTQKKIEIAIKKNTEELADGIPL